MSVSIQTDTSTCAHCGDPCLDEARHSGDVSFCCAGCETVYSLLQESGLGAYYKLGDDAVPGISMRALESDTRFSYLDDPDVNREILEYTDGNLALVTLRIPQIHCASCIWLLENLSRLEPAVRHAEVFFDRREVSIRFDIGKLPLSRLAALLASIGYTPDFSMDRLGKTSESSPHRSTYLKIGVAGFAFGNIMLFSLPEYLTSGGVDAQFRTLFGALNIILALPVFLYSSQDFFRPAWKSASRRQWSMDIAISLGIIAMFFRSLYEIVTGLSPGYMDSFTMLVFLLLVGRLFQTKTYESLSFERDYRAYFPLSVIRLSDAGTEESVAATKLMEEDTVIIRNGELLPADAELLDTQATMDFSFVTGESDPVVRRQGDLVYAGGRNRGVSARFRIRKPVSGSYLTRLWNNDVFRKDTEDTLKSLSQKFSRYFSPAVLAIAAISALYWLPQSAPTALNAFTAVLIVACPCALALSAPFTLGWATNLLGKARFYLKNGEVVEHLSSIDTVVFDKTGTLTHRESAEVDWNGRTFTKSEFCALQAVLHENTHPLGRQVYRYLDRAGLSPLTTPDAREDYESTNEVCRAVAFNTNFGLNPANTPAPATTIIPESENDSVLTSAPDEHMRQSSPYITAYREESGKGVEAVCDGIQIRLGSFAWAGSDAGVVSDRTGERPDSRIWVQIDGQTAGYFEIRNQYRSGLRELLSGIGEGRSLYVLSGDNDRERERLSQYVSSENLFFSQTPEDKLNHIQTLESSGCNVLMVGDGLNDAGALKSSTVGVSVAEDTSSFTPASDVIMDAGSLRKLPSALRFARDSKRIIYSSFGISVMYNIVGLGFAVTGTLSPLICAIIMPVSSVTVIAWTSLATHWSAWKTRVLQ